MKKIFLYIVLTLLFIFVLSAFLAEYYAPLSEPYLTVAMSMKGSLTIILAAAAAAWLGGTTAGGVIGVMKKPVRAFILHILRSIGLIPAFLLTALVITAFGGGFYVVLYASMIPVFLMTAETAAEHASKIRESGFAAPVLVRMGACTFIRQYLLPLFGNPALAALLNAFCLLIYMDLALGILGVMPAYTMGSLAANIIRDAEISSMMALSISIVLIMLTNIACLLATPAGPCKTEEVTKWIKH